MRNLNFYSFSKVKQTLGNILKVFQKLTNSKMWNLEQEQHFCTRSGHFAQDLAISHEHLSFRTVMRNSKVNGNNMFEAFLDHFATTCKILHEHANTLLSLLHIFLIWSNSHNCAKFLILHFSSLFNLIFSMIKLNASFTP